MTRAIDTTTRRRAIRLVLDTYNKPTDAAVLATERAVDALLAAGWRPPADDAAVERDDA